MQTVATGAPAGLVSERGQAELKKLEEDDARRAAESWCLAQQQKCDALEAFQLAVKLENEAREVLLRIRGSVTTVGLNAIKTRTGDRLLGPGLFDCYRSNRLGRMDLRAAGWTKTDFVKSERKLMEALLNSVYPRRVNGHDAEAD